MRSSSFDEGPLGFLSQISHFRTVETLVLRTAARTDWLRCRLSRNSRIPCALVLIDGKQALAGRYPTRAELARWSGASVVKVHPDSVNCCSGGNCG